MTSTPRRSLRSPGLIALLAARLSTRWPLFLALGAAGAFLLAAPQVARAVGEQDGRVRGVVTNPATGQPLEGVTITATGPALIGAPRVTFTNAAGRYELLDLPPGRYDITYSYPGTVAAKRSVYLQQEQAATINVAYALEAEATETVAVSAGRQLTNPDSAQTGSVLDIETLNRLPTGRSYQDVPDLLPGVSDTDGDGNVGVKGAAGNQNKYLIDGLDVTDPVTNTFATNLTFDSTQSVAVITGGMDAEYNALGGVINVITQGGGDQFRAISSLYANHHRLSARSNFGPTLYEGRQPFDKAKLGPTQTYQGSVDVGGPILKRKLWYALTYEYDYTGRSTAKGAPLGVAPYDIQHPSRTYDGHHSRLKLAWAPADKQRVWLSGNAEVATIENTVEGNSRLGVAENRQRQGGIFTVAGWEWRLSENFIPSVQAGFLYNFLNIGPMGWYGKFDDEGCTKFSPANCVYDRDRPRHVNLVDNTTWYQGNSKQYDTRQRVQIDPNLRIRGNLLGAHTLKLGLQGQFLRNTWDYRIPGGSIYSDRSPSRTPLEQGLCDPAAPNENCFLRTDVKPFKSIVKGWGVGAYVQDRWWTPLQWLTINPGLRFDYGTSDDHKGRQVTEFFALAPRFGFTADLTQNGRNVLFGHYGRNTEPVSLNAAGDFASNSVYFESTNRWTGTAWQEVSRFSGEESSAIDKDAKIPRSDEITGGFRREIVPNAVASIEYTWKRVAHAWDSYEINRIWDPTGSRTVGWVDRAKYGTEVYLVATPEDPVVYNGLLLSTEGRPTPQLDYGANYTLSWTTFRETISNPRFQRFQRGFAGSDLRHYLRLFGSYLFADRVTVGGFLQYQTGTPRTKFFSNYELGDNSVQRSPSGTTPGAGTSANNFAAISEFRVPNFLRADFRVMVNLLPPKSPHNLHLVFDVFNAFNLDVPTEVENEDLPTFGQVVDRQTPLRVQLGLSYTFGATASAYAEAGREGEVESGRE